MQFKELKKKKRKRESYTTSKIDHKMPQKIRKPLVEQLPINFSDFITNLLKIEPHVLTYICQPIKSRELSIYILYNSEN